MKHLAACLCLLTLAGGVSAQEARIPEAPQVPAAAPTPEPPGEPEHHGKILFERDSESAPAAAGAMQTPIADPTATLTEAEREAPVFTAYDLEVHLTPATASIAAHAHLRVRNAGAMALTRLAMQLSSTLRWDSISLASGDRGTMAPAQIVRQTLDSDVDHTGRVSEAVVSLPKALAPGEEIALDVFYSGNLPASAERLERVGAPHDEALAADWDGIATGDTHLRGFGDVLWYPAAAPPVLLGDGAKLFQTVGEAKRRQATAAIHLRLTVEYLGEPPDAAYFCGRRAPLKAVGESAEVSAAMTPGVATAEWAEQPLGFRAMSLFLTDHPAKPVVEGLLSAVTEHDDAIASYAAAAQMVQPMLNDWFGAFSDAVTLIDHPGQPFADDTVLLNPMQTAQPATLAPAMAHVLTHAWFRSTQAWLDEGMPEFANLLWLERSQGRDVALHVLVDTEQTVALAEPAEAASSATQADLSEASGHSLIASSNEVFFRAKAAAVLWMLRAAAGDDALKQALRAYRASATLDTDPHGFEQALETASGKDLRWFFDDWVYNDHGLPDLSIANVTPSLLAQKPGDNASWLVAVDVKNAGGAAALVPVTVRSGKSSATQTVRVPARGGATVRILCPGAPEEVILNDGSVPEMAVTGHRQAVVVH